MEYDNPRSDTSLRHLPAALIASQMPSYLTCLALTNFNPLSALKWHGINLVARIVLSAIGYKLIKKKGELVEKVLLAPDYYAGNLGVSVHKGIEQLFSSLREDLRKAQEFHDNPKF